MIDSPRKTSKCSIKIAKDVWIGVNCVILTGVTIGRAAMIVAVSVVTKNVRAYSVYVGNPAKPMRMRHMHACGNSPHKQRRGGSEALFSQCARIFPLYRESASLNRDTGLDIGRSAMVGWVMQVGELLQPIALVMRSELLAGGHIQANKTPVGVQMQDSRGMSH